MIFESLQRVFARLNRKGVRYLVVGGWAVAAHGHVRATQDLDLVVALDQENARLAIDALESLGYAPTAPVQAREFTDAEVRGRWIAEKNMIVFQMRAGGPEEIPVDLFVALPFDFEAASAAAMSVELRADLQVPVVSLPMLMDMKRAAGRPQDLADLEALGRFNRAEGQA